MEEIMSSRTVFLSRLIGLYCILVVLSMLIHRQAKVDSLVGVLHNPSLILVLGVITLAAGLAMVLAHNIWSGSALAVVVTLVGWLTLLKGMLFLFLPPEIEAECILRCIHHPHLLYVCMAPSLLIGIYLAYGGFRSRLHS
jgi:putative exporter of polyketide antibiotics